MTGLELANDVGKDTRDTDHIQYPLTEKLTYIKRGVRVITVRLAAMGHPMVCKLATTGSEDWSATVTPGQSGVELPSDYLTTFSLFIVGQESPGPLGLVAPAERFSLTGSQPQGYYIMGGAVGAPTLHLVPAPAEAMDLSLHYAALPAFCQLSEPASEEAARAQLDQELPFGRVFFEAMRQWVALCCLNRNEYDTSVEQGLWKLCQDQAQQLADLDNLQSWGPAGGADSNWGGR